MHLSSVLRLQSWTFLKYAGHVQHDQHISCSLEILNALSQKIRSVMENIRAKCYGKNHGIQLKIPHRSAQFITITYFQFPGAMSAILLVGMMFLQNFRRLMECILVSVYSKGTMNFAHYAMGIVLYSTFNFAVMSEAPDLLGYKSKFTFLTPSTIAFLPYCGGILPLGLGHPEILQPKK